MLQLFLMLVLLLPEQQNLYIVVESLLEVRPADERSADKLRPEERVHIARLPEIF